MARDGTSEDHVDVLIVGAGPAGLMMATWMAKCGVKTRIVDKRGTKESTPLSSNCRPRPHANKLTVQIFNGQADGLQCRTLEIFDSFDFALRAWTEANHMLEICLWNPDADGVIRRGDRMPDTIPGISRFTEIVLHQGRIERYFLDSIEQWSKIRVERGVMPLSLDFDASLAEDTTAYPITVKLRHLSEEEATPKLTATSTNGAATQDGLFRSNLTPDDTADLLRASSLNDKANTEEVVHAKYMLGADGAHSWVRNQLGFKLEGESTDYIWGVLDIVPITDFPDIRMRCAIHSAESGSVMVIPRENKLVRLYIQLTTTERVGEAESRADRSAINPDTILQSAQRIMHPYKLTYRKLDWWTAYQIGQRVGTNFSANERIFLAGDAVHTHSPKAGQGMNVSMQDAFNLGWKVANVVQGTCRRQILKTYQSERRRIAQDLIEFDHKFSRLFSGRPAKDVMDEEGISMDEFKSVFEKGALFASGVAVDYGASSIVVKPGSSTEQGDGTDVSVSASTNGSNGAHDPIFSSPDLARKIPIGQRLPSAQVLNQADARPWDMQQLLKSNGTWRIIVFAGDISAHAGLATKLATLGEKLGAQDSFLRRYTPEGARYDSVIETLLVHAAPRRDVTVFDFPEVFRQFDELEGWDYWKIYVDDESYHEGHGHAYQKYGIDAGVGCVLVLRPDHHTSYVGPLEDYESLRRFFDGIMVPRR